MCRRLTECVLTRFYNEKAMRIQLQTSVERKNKCNGMTETNKSLLDDIASKKIIKKPQNSAGYETLKRFGVCLVVRYIVICSVYRMLTKRNKRNCQEFNK